MKYNKINYKEKISRLHSALNTSARLSEEIGVSRRTLLNWRDRPESITPAHRLDIDVLYCKYTLIPEWDTPKHRYPEVLLADDIKHRDTLLMPFLRRLSYGTIEIERDMRQADFDKAIDEEKLPRNMSRQSFQEAINTWLTHQWIWQKIVGHGEKIALSEESIRSLHTALMRGVNEDAGFYSTKIRVMGQLDGVNTTLPEDIPEEMNRWAYKCAEASTLQNIAKAHAYFMAIHPFGDGNGRVGRALVMIQCLHARLMPPLFNGENRAIYYAAMEHAMVHGRYAPLIRLFYEAAERNRSTNE